MAEPAAPGAGWTLDEVRALKKVRGGLLMIYLAIIGFLVAITVFVITTGAVSPQVMDSRMDLLAVVVVALGVVVLLGIVMCLFAPSESTAFPFAIASLILKISTILFLDLIAVLFRAPARLLFTDSSELIGLFLLASTTSFLIYLRRLANYLGRPEIARYARWSMLVGLASAALLVVGFQGLQPRVVGFLVVFPVHLFGTLIVAGVMGSLIAAVMYTNTIGYLRKAISEAVG